MSASSGALLGAPASGRHFQLGRTFLHPAFDYLLIGGGLSLVAGLLLPGEGRLYPEQAVGVLLPYCLLLFNSAHFAASTVRLYTRPGAFKEWPFLTMGLPIATIALLTLCVAFSKLVGQHLVSLYFTWSPYHYAAQAFGLAAMYCYRSGCKLSEPDRRLLWWSCMLPFLYAFSTGGSSGIGWLVPQSLFAAHPSLLLAKHWVSQALIVLTFAVPLVLVVRLGRSGGSGFPLIGLLIMISNGIWWIVFPFLHAFLWATVFHGVQYLAIVTIFHVRDHTALPGSRHGWLYYSAVFYGMCLVLGYGLFHVWPYAYVAAGFKLSESLLLVAAAINIHHFIVDRYIWRLRRDPNYRIVVGRASGAAAPS